MDSIHELVDRAFRTPDVASEFSSVGDLMHGLAADLRLPMFLELMEHPPVHTLLHQISNITLVYSPPKVGSTTISETLRRLPAVNARSKVRHLHFVSAGGIQLLEEAAARFHDRPEAQLVMQALMHGRWVRVLLAANRAVRVGVPGDKSVQKPILITGVREPIAQYLSAIFEIRWMYAAAADRITADKVRGWVYADPWYRQYANWFAEELGGVFGLDVLRSPFPAHRGWDVYETDAARVLLVRQEDLDALAEALGTFYNLEPAAIDVSRANEGGNKSYAAEYADLKRSFRLSPEELDRVYSLPHVCHFYTPQEIAGFKTYWSSPAEERRSINAARAKARSRSPRKHPRDRGCSGFPPWDWD